MISRNFTYSTYCMIACMGPGLLHISWFVSPLRISHLILIKSVNPRLLNIGNSLRVMLYIYHRPIFTNVIRTTNTPTFGHHQHCRYVLGLFCLPLQILVDTLSSEMQVRARTKVTYSGALRLCRVPFRITFWHSTLVPCPGVMLASQPLRVVRYRSEG